MGRDAEAGLTTLKANLGDASPEHSCQPRGSDLVEAGDQLRLQSLAEDEISLEARAASREIYYSAINAKGSSGFPRAHSIESHPHLSYRKHSVPLKSQGS